MVEALGGGRGGERKEGLSEEDPPLQAYHITDCPFGASRASGSHLRNDP